jgi:hypothetical protein
VQNLKTLALRALATPGVVQSVSPWCAKSASKAGSAAGPTCAPARLKIR